jgi:phosphoribosyl-dephospho-CoA transferase
LFSQNVNPQVHDLLQIDPDSFGDPTAPCWAVEALQSFPWAVVRRVPSAPREVAIGVRGKTRDQRWAGFIAKSSIRSIVQPMDLIAIHNSSILIPRTPAMRALQQVIERWKDCDLPWGPTGSVALELVSGKQITTESSDLDIAISASNRLCFERARSLWDRIADLQPGVDIRVEAPECGFSLQEYVRTSSAKILLRYRDGVSLGDDPWSPRPTPARMVP